MTTKPTNFGRQKKEVFFASMDKKFKIAKKETNWFPWTAFNTGTKFKFVDKLDLTTKPNRSLNKNPMNELERVRKMQHRGKEVLIVDYSDRIGDAMIEIFDRAKSLALEENKHFVILNIFNNKTFISPHFMRHIEKNLSEVDGLIDKQAVIGLSTVQVWILKGMNLWYDRQIYNFNSLDEALDFLTMDQQGSNDHRPIKQ